MHAWIRTYQGVDRRAKAIAVTGDAALIEWGNGQVVSRGVGVVGGCEVPHRGLSEGIAVGIVGAGGVCVRAIP